MTIHIGIVGAGSIGRAHAKAAQAAGVQVDCVADIDEQVAQQFGSKFDIAHVTTEPGQLFERPELDAVVIAAPNKYHAALAVAAMEAGKDVLVEKPMAISATDCNRMIAAATQHDRLLQVGLTNRYSAVAASARQFIEAGRLGKIYHARASWCRRRGIPGLGGWFTTRAISGGGVLVDLGVHLIDLVMHLMGDAKVSRVSGKTYAHFGTRMADYVYEHMWAGPPDLSGTCDVEDAAHAMIHFDTGATFELNTTWAGNFPDGSTSDQVMLLGDRGGMTFSLGGTDLKLATEQDGHNVDITAKLRPADAFTEQMRAFATNIKSRQYGIAATGTHGRMVQQIIEAIYASSDQDSEIAL